MWNASDYIVGGFLGLWITKNPHVIDYAFRILNSAQINYSTNEKELIVLIFSLKKFRSYLVGTKVTIYSDNTIVKYFLPKKDANLGSSSGFSY